MVCFCFLVDQRRKVRRSKPVAGSCSRCGRGASVADIITQTSLNVAASNPVFVAAATASSTVFVAALPPTSSFAAQ
ncbi:hypothetical protein AAHE18_08G169200 [Arachis hypogaea]|uniref:Uncharacterized protein n=1 Tax=Arachis hypogaea TaxID=3818 RepID=A0A445BYJ0_ARAHY|nr:hypothetical protein Ahy_A08g040198 [Arachis hypogaea]